MKFFNNVLLITMLFCGLMPSVLQSAMQASDAAQACGASRSASDASGDEGMGSDFSRMMAAVRASRAADIAANKAARRCASDSSGDEEMLKSAAVGGDSVATRHLLAAAIERADAQGVYSLLICEPDVVHGNLIKSEPPLVRAALAGRTNVVRVLLDAAADPNKARTEDGATPLLAACQNGLLSIAQLLIARKASVTAQDSQGVFPLYLAYANRYEKLCKLLLAQGADITQKTKPGSTLLMRVCMDNNEHAARQLVAAGADVNAISDTGNTPLRAAITGENVKIVNLLLELQADPNKTSEGGDTPLMSAVIHEQPEMVKALLAARANPMIINAHQSNALYYASHPGIQVMLEEAQRAWRAAPKQEADKKEADKKEVVEHKE